MSECNLTLSLTRQVECCFPNSYFTICTPYKKHLERGTPLKKYLQGDWCLSVDQSENFHWFFFYCLTSNPVRNNMKTSSAFSAVFCSSSKSLPAFVTTNLIGSCKKCFRLELVRMDSSHPAAVQGYVTPGEVNK